MGFRARNISF